jgi:cell wall-associated NlpC family hydrolase
MPRVTAGVLATAGTLAGLTVAAPGARAGTAVPAGLVPPATATVPALGHPAVAPLRRSVQPGLLVVAPAALPAGLLAAVRKLPGLTAAESVEAFRLKVNGADTAVIGADPSVFRSFAAPRTGAATALWQGVADGGIALSYTMGKLDQIKAGGSVVAAGATSRKLAVSALGTLGIGGVDAVVSDATAKALGAPSGNALVISVEAADFAADSAAVKKLLPRGAGLEPLATLVPGAKGGTGSVDGAPVGAGSAGSTGAPSAAIGVMLQAALSRLGLPYVWGGSGPSTFDCSGLVQWSFARAGIAMPRVAADQALAGPSVPVSQLAPGDLLFYHTDPTAPGYISHVAIYLGNGQMIQAPEPGENVEVVPAAFGSEFAGAVRVSPAQAAAVAGRIA